MFYFSRLLLFLGLFLFLLGVADRALARALITMPALLVPMAPRRLAQHAFAVPLAARAQQEDAADWQQHHSGTDRHPRERAGDGAC